jgi:hypothetical protein
MVAELSKEKRSERVPEAQKENQIHHSHDQVQRTCVEQAATTPNRGKSRR